MLLSTPWRLAQLGNQREISLRRHNFRTLMTRLSRAGFRRHFIDAAVLPDWWDDNCANDATLLPEIELRVARFLGLPLDAVRNPGAQLVPSAYAGAQLRRAGGIDRERLGPAIHAAVAVAGAVVRNVRQRREVDLPPAEGLFWRQEIQRPAAVVTLDDLCRDLWARGIPVVPLEVLPSPKFQGAACVAEGRPVVLIGHRNDEPGRVAFWIAHEAGHIAAGDCAPDAPVVDAEESADDSPMELRADRYASRVLIGSETVPDLGPGGFRQIARQAVAIERETGGDASAILFSWAAKTGQYSEAVRAVSALYRAKGARRIVREHLDRNVDIDAASETDCALLRCVAGDSEHLAAVG